MLLHIGIQRKSIRFGYRELYKPEQLEIIIDILKGGKMAFQQIRDDTNPPIHAIHYGKEATLVRTRCSKEGSDSFKVKPGHNICQGPIQLQDQHAQVLQVQQNKILLDRKIK